MKKNKYLLFSCLIAMSSLVSCNNNKEPSDTSSIVESPSNSSSLVETPSDSSSSSETPSDSSSSIETPSDSSSSIETPSDSSSSSENPSDSSSSIESPSDSSSSSGNPSNSSSSIETPSDSSSSTQNPSEEVQQWTNNDFGDYYKSIDFSDNDDLLYQLQSLNKAKKKITIGYGKLWDHFSETDYYPANKSKYVAFYQGTAASRGEMNKEHVWPKSHGGNLVEGDIHMTRPTLSSDNSSRGNSFYVEGMKSSSQGWDPKAAGMNEQYRGQAARIIFYCVVADNNLSIIDKSYSATSNSNRDNKMGKLSDLLKWNLEYEVHQTELNRNNGAQKVQGNRNPFIDNPYLACAIWGNVSATTRQICADYGVYIDPVTGDMEIQGETPSTPSEPETPSTPSEPETPSTPSEPSQPEISEDGTYTKVTSQSDLVVGGQYLLVCESKKTVAGALNSTYLQSVSVTISNNSITSKPSDAQAFILGGNAGAYTLATENNETLACSETKKLSYSGSNNLWKIVIENGTAKISNTAGSTGTIQYNSSAPRFTTYSTSQNAISLYKLTA